MQLDRDFYLYVAHAEAADGITVAAHAPVKADGGEAEPGTFLAMISPDAVGSEAKPTPKDVVFVVDTSGSMSEGQKMVQARSALRHCIGRLTPDDRFALVPFSSEARPVHTQLTAATPAAVQAADTEVVRFEPRGGTAMSEGLLAALRMLQGGGDRPAYLVLVTDGRPTVGETNGDALAKMIRSQAGRRTRCFVIGVGQDLNTKLCDKLAAEHRGQREYILDHEEIEERISAFYDRIAYPVLTDLQLTIDGAQVTDLYPKRLPDLFRGTQLTVLGRFAEAGVRTVTLTGKVGGETRTFTYEIDLGDTTAGGDLLPRVWAVRKIGYLLEEIRLNGEADELRDEVIRLARRHRVVTPYTSFLVVEDESMLQRGGGGRRVSRGGRPVEDPVVRDAEETDSNEEFEESVSGEANTPSDKPFQGRYWSDALGVGGGAGGAFGGRFGGKRDLVARGGGGRGTERAVEGALKWLRNHQSLGGSWSAHNFTAMCKKNVCGGIHGDPNRSVGTTALATLAFLGAGHSMRHGKYKEVVKRALKYLRSIQTPDGCVGPKGGSHWMLDHVLASMALSEAYGLSGMTPSLKGPSQKAVDFLVSAQNPYLGWGRGIRTGSDDLQVTTWAVMALKAAKLSELTVAPEGYAGAKVFLDKFQSSLTPRTTPLDAAARIFMGANPSDPHMRKAGTLLAASVPKWTPEGAGNDFERWSRGIPRPRRPAIWAGWARRRSTRCRSRSTTATARCWAAAAAARARAGRAARRPTHHRRRPSSTPRTTAASRPASRSTSSRTAVAAATAAARSTVPGAPCWASSSRCAAVSGPT
ncbi:MAG: VWA domain-containing protein [Planctomycetota bacterium]